MKLYIENGTDVNHNSVQVRVFDHLTISNLLLEYMIVYIQYDITQFSNINIYNAYPNCNIP